MISRHKLVLVVIAGMMISLSLHAQMTGYWTFDNHCLDLKGSHHGQLFGGWFTENAALGSHSVELGPKDTSRTVWVGNFDPSDADLTISMWINPHPDGHGDQILMAKRNAWKEEELRWQFLRRAPRKPHQMKHGSDDVIRFESYSMRAEVKYKFEPDTWYHIALVYRSDVQLATFYVNGGQVGVSQKVILGEPRDVPVVIGGGRPGDWWEIFQGRIDDVCIWTEALDPAVVGAIHALGSDPGFKWDAGLVRVLVDLHKQKNPDWKVPCNPYEISYAEKPGGQPGKPEINKGSFSIILDKEKGTGITGKRIAK